MSLENFIYESVADLLDGKYDTVNKRVEKHKDIYNNDTAICFSLLSLSSFLHKDYSHFYQFMNDASFLVDQTKEPITKLFHEIVLGFVNFSEKNTTLYSINYNRARKLTIKNQHTDFFEKVNSMLKCPPITHFTPNHGGQTKDPLLALVKIGQAVAAEKDINLLIKTIAEETKTALNADRCTVYLYDKDTNELYSKVATGLYIKELRVPANKGLAGHVLKTGETINIKDAYSDKRFNSDIDKETGYRTKNMLCMPIKNFNQEIIGVFQVLNKFDEYFTPEDEDLLVAIASNAGISLENAQLFERQRKLARNHR
jgi:putative methionine-R-sulfoxide reductase with GAF domain